MSLPPGYSIIEADSDETLQSFAQLALDYSRWLGVDLCFQAFDKELALLPGCYSRPEGCILLLQHQPIPDTPAQAVGCVAVRPLSTNHTAHAQPHSSPAPAAADATQIPLPNHTNFQQEPASSCQDGTESSNDAQAMGSEQQFSASSTKGGSDPDIAASTAASAHMDLSSVCEMKRLWVSKGHTGKGLGRALAVAAVAAARQCGYSSMVLDTLQSLSAANKLYEGLGFVQRDAYYPNPLPDVVYWQLQL